MRVEEGGVVNEGRRAGGKIEVMDGDVEKLEGRARGDRMSLLNIQFYSRWSFVLLSAACGYMCESMERGERRCSTDAVPMSVGTGSGNLFRELAIDCLLFTMNTEGSVT